MRHGHRTEGSGHAPVHAACMKKGTIELCGADRWAEEWARERQVPYLGMPARWTAEGEWSRPPAQRAQMAALPGVAASWGLPGGDWH